jgi:hypothetical protein
MELIGKDQYNIISEGYARRADNAKKKCCPPPGLTALTGARYSG